MKLKNLFITLGLSLAVGVGALFGMSKAPVKEAKAASMTCTFKVASSELSSWGNVDNWGIYVWHDTTPILDAFDDCYGNMSLSDGFYTKTVAHSDSIDGVILLFKQSTQKWRSENIVFAGGLKDGKTYQLSYSAWVNNDDGEGRKTFTATAEDTSVAPVYSLIGDFGGHNWDYDVDFAVDQEHTTATLNSVDLVKGNSFKVRKNHDWATTYAWSAANGHINITDSQDRGEDCLGDAGPNDHNIAVLHNGTYNFSLNYSTGVLTITGTRAASDSAIAFEMYISTGGATFAPFEMALKGGSETEYMITRDLVAGDKMYFKFGSSYYHFSDFKANEGTIKDKQFVNDGENNALALYSGNYTIYFETDSEGGNFGGWFQYNSVSEAQIRANVISYATYFNDEVGGVCKNDGSTDISKLQAAWTNVKTRYDNSPAASVKAAIASATGEDANAEVSEFVGKYARVYELRGASLSAQGGDFLFKGIVPQTADVVSLAVKNNGNTTLIIVVVASIAAISAFGILMFIKRRKEN